MKYLKHFDNENQIKKYIVIERKTNYVIFRVILKSISKIELEQLFIINKSSLEPIKSKSVIVSFTPDIINDVVYQSDTLEDTLNQIKTLITTRKYNL